MPATVVERQLNEYMFKVCTDLHPVILELIATPSENMALDLQLALNSIMSDPERGDAVEMDLVADTYLSVVPSAEPEQRYLLTCTFACYNALLPMYLANIFVAIRGTSVNLALFNGSSTSIISETSG